MKREKELPLEILEKDVFFEPGVDYVFKSVFGSEAHKDVLKGLLCAILGMSDEEIEDVTIMNGELTKQNTKDKLSRLDILLKLNNSKIINIEMQMINYKTLFNRIIGHSYIFHLQCQEKTMMS